MPMKTQIFIAKTWYSVLKNDICSVRCYNRTPPTFAYTFTFFKGIERELLIFLNILSKRSNFNQDLSCWGWWGKPTRVKEKQQRNPPFLWIPSKVSKKRIHTTDFNFSKHGPFHFQTGHNNETFIWIWHWKLPIFIIEVEMNWKFDKRTH